MKKDDARKLDHATLEAMRIRAVDGIVTPPRTCGRSGGQVAKGMKKISYS